MGDSDVPYFSLADWAELMTYLMHTYIKKDQNISFELSFSMEGNTGVLTRACPTLSDAMDCSPPGSSVHGIFQARVLEWGAIAFSVYAEYIMRTLGWKKHKLESRLLGEISITSDMQMTPPLWQKVKKN